MVHNSTSYFLSQVDIIVVGLYLLSCLQKIPCDELWTGLASYEKGIFYSAVLVRGRYFFTRWGKIMKEKDVSGFKLACKNYLITLDLNSLRTYGRALQIRTPTMMRKADLIEEIIKVLCGENSPQRNNRGAPVKSAYLDESIFETVERIQKKYFEKETDGETATNAVEEQETIPPVRVEPVSESRLEPLQFTVRFSLLNEEQKNLFLAFLNSL